jgi:putative ABC transport system ATP-binding protein
VGLRVRAPAPPRDAKGAEQKRLAEARRSGNPLLLPSDAWLDWEAAGDQDAMALDRRIMELLSCFGVADEVRHRGLLSQLDPALTGDITARIVDARREVAVALREPARARLVQQFDRGRFNRNATLAENLLFGSPTSERLAPAALGADPYVRSILQAEAMLFPLAAIGLRMAEGAIEMFARLPPGSPLFERLSYIQPDELAEFARIAEQARKDGLPRLGPAAMARLIELGLAYNEPRYRMGVLDASFEQRVVRARESLITYLPDSYKREVELFDPERPIPSATIRDNVLFGRLSTEVVDAEAQVDELAWHALRGAGLEGVVISLGLSTQVGPAGRQLQARQRGAVALARALLPRPDTLILDGALASYGLAESRTIMDRIRSEWAGRTLLATVDGSEGTDGFDRVLTFEGTRLVADTPPDAVSTRPAPAHGARRTPALAS